MEEHNDFLTTLLAGTMGFVVAFVLAVLVLSSCGTA